MEKISKLGPAKPAENDMALIRTHVQIPRKLKSVAEARAAQLCFPNFTTYLHHLLRVDAGLTTTTESR